MFTHKDNLSTLKGTKLRLRARDSSIFLCKKSILIIYLTYIYKSVTILLIKWFLNVTKVFLRCLYFMRGYFMARNRETSKANRKKGKLEEKLSFKNAFDIKDPTPYQSIINIINKERGFIND